MTGDRFVSMQPDKDGIPRVKAILKYRGVLPSGAKQFGTVMQVPAQQSERRLLGALYLNGEFIHKAALLKRARQAKAKGVKVDRIVWSYHDFGYGNSLAHVGRETVRWLKKLGKPVFVRPWNNQPNTELGVPYADDEMLKTSAVIVMDRYPVPDHVFESLKNAPFIAGYYMLEGTRLREWEFNRLEGYDAIFTPSSFCQKALVESGVGTPVFVWGHGIDHEVFPYAPPKSGRPFTFLWFGDENRRKGYDLFLEAFSRVTVPNVRAWVRGPGSGGVSGVRAKYQNDPRIVWDTKVTPPDQLKELMAEADVLVAPLRGEGFGLCLLEAMASGRPMIATQWSGPLDFGGGPDLTYWIKVAGHEPAQNDSGVQVIPSMTDLIETMTKCAQNPAEAQSRGVRASAAAHANWRWERKVLEVIPYLKQMIPDFSI